MLYLLLSVPGVWMLYRLYTEQATADMLLHGSGEFSARLMIVALAVTPLRHLFAGTRWVSWLVRNRRAFGVCAFAYAGLHTVFYVADMGSIEFMLAELGALGIWTGWLALLVMLPLAITSNNWSVRVLQQRWQLLHRGVYLAAVAVLIHWLFVHNNVVAAWLHFVPLILLEVFRVYSKVVRSR